MKKPIPKPSPSEEDNSLWAELTHGVAKTKQPELIELPPIELPEIRNSVDTSIAYHGEKLTKLEIGSTANIDGKNAQRFRRGEYKIERRLDLHGYTEERAFDAVENFIKNAYIEGLRCVLIVTGKGLPHQEDDIYTTRGVLKDKVPLMLNFPQLRPLILSISYSQPKDGGEGALYVLLRKKRD